MDYEISIRVRNGRILAAMRRHGIRSVSELARRAGIHVGTALRLVNLLAPPMSRWNGKWVPAVVAIADVLKVAPDDLFTDTQRASVMATNRRHIAVSEAEVATTLTALEQRAIDPVKLIESSERDQLLTEALEDLPKQEREVIIRRFGLNGGTAETLDSIAADYKLSRERINQIEARALQKLRSPAIIKKLRDFDPAPTGASPFERAIEAGWVPPSKRK